MDKVASLILSMNGFMAARDLFQELLDEFWSETNESGDLKMVCEMSIEDFKKYKRALSACNRSNAN